MSARAKEAMMARTEQQTMLSVRVPRELLKELEEVAVHEDRSVAAEVRRLIRRHVETFRGSLGGQMAGTP
jgi:predicted DNA-binding protein